MKRIYETSSNHPFPGGRKRRDIKKRCLLKEKSCQSQALPTNLQRKKKWRNIHNCMSTSHLSFVWWLKACPCSPSPPFSGGAREHDMAYLTQITALCPTIHFLLGMQVASWDKQPCIQSNSRKQLHISPPSSPPLYQKVLPKPRGENFLQGTKGTDLKDLQEEIPPTTHLCSPPP